LEVSNAELFGERLRARAFFSCPPLLFKADPISLNEIASLRKKTSELVDKVGFDDGPSS
jgi:hypothetical protein